jgi:hypothetical protein
LRGTVRDAESNQPLMGATVTLESGRSSSTTVSVATNPEGAFSFENLRPGYYTLSVSLDGFEGLRLVELNVASGKEQTLDLLLQSAPGQLPEATILAPTPGRRKLLPVGEIPLSREQTLRFPATFFDPLRLATAYPGVAQTDDGTNSISIRGNSPSSVRWRLEGVEIVNPNHLPNAGTFSDRPATASGGVLMFSAQLLDNSSLLTGVMPAGYGDANGGIVDMYLRKGSDQQHEFTAQAGLIGLDIAAEGPLGKRKQESGQAPASYLVNYRYSTVGLLGQLGVSFGDEQINFQDLSFNLNFKGRKGGNWSVFGMGGLSENNFRHKSDTAEIKAYKDFFDIDFSSKTGVIGVRNFTQYSHGVWLKTSAAASGQYSERLSSSPTFLERNSTDNISETALSYSSTIGFPLNSRFDWQIGVIGTVRFYQANSQFEGGEERPIEVQYTTNQPWAQISWKNAQKTTEAEFGLHMYSLNVSSQSQETSAFNPRASFSQRFGRHKFIAAAGYFTEALPFWATWQQDNLNTRSSLKASLGYVWAIAPRWSFRAEGFWQWFNETPFLGASFASMANISDFRVFPSSSSSGVFFLTGGRNLGIEMMLERRFSGDWFANLNATLIDSKYPAPDQNGLFNPRLVSSRWDIGHIANLTFGKEWQREKRPGRERSIGLNGRAVWTGGVREAEIHPVSKQLRTTVFNEFGGFNKVYPDYFRLDVRVYWRKYIGNRRNSTFALEFQNLTNKQNFAYHYYDPYTERVENKFQLGTIPNFSWRVEF